MPKAISRRCVKVVILIVLLVTQVGTSFVLAERLWLDLYRMQAEDLQVSETPQPPSLLLGCRFPGCFPGFSGERLTLQVRTKGPFLRRWVLNLAPFSQAERNRIILGGSAQWQNALSRENIILGSEATISGLDPRDEKVAPLAPIIVDLDFEKLREVNVGTRTFPQGFPQLVLEVRQLIGGVEVNRWRFSYDFAAFLAPNDQAPALLPEQDRIELHGYSRQSSPIVLLARGDLSSRKTDVYCSGAQAIDIGENMTEATKNVEVAVWAYDHQPLLLIQPRLTSAADPIPASAPGTLGITPQVWLPQGSLVSGKSWEDLARCDFAVANRLFKRNRMGVKLVFPSTTGRVPATRISDLCDSVPSLKSSGVLQSKNWNVFYVDVPYRSQNCCRGDVPEVVFITRSANPTTLAHEVGHSFGLLNFDVGGNLMMGGVVERSGLTLQQVYLAVFGSGSTLNSLGLRTAAARDASACPSQCSSNSTIVTPECVSSESSFFACMANSIDDPASPIERLLSALESDESDLLGLPFLDYGFFSGIPNAVPFLKRIGKEGIRTEAISRQIFEIGKIMQDSDCPDIHLFDDLYRSRALVNSKRGAILALSSLHTKEAKDALEVIRESASEDLKKEIGELLSTW